MISQLGFAYSQMGLFEKALWCYKRWLELNPQSSRPLYCIGFIFYQQENWQEALAWFDLALEADPGYVVCMYRKALVLLRQFKYRPAKDILKESINIYSQFCDENQIKRLRKYYYRSIFYLGKAYLGIGHFSNAEKCFYKVSREEKYGYIKDIFIQYNLAKSLYLQNKPAPAEQILKGLTEQKDAKAWVWNLMGMVQTTKGNRSSAMQNFEEALKRSKSPYIFLSRAEAWQNFKEPEKALADLHQALRRDRKGRHKIYLKIAQIYLRQHKISEALNSCHQAIHIKKKIWNHDYAEAHLTLSEIYRSTGQAQKAKQEMNLAFKIRPALEWSDNWYIIGEEAAFID